MSLDYLSMYYFCLTMTKIWSRNSVVLIFCWNLHVVFTMNPANPDFSNRTASSPALFNRCVIDWFGDWSDDGLLQVTKSFTEHVDIP